MQALNHNKYDSRLEPSVSNGMKRVTLDEAPQEVVMDNRRSMGSFPQSDAVSHTELPESSGVELHLQSDLSERNVIEKLHHFLS